MGLQMYEKIKGTSWPCSTKEMGLATLYIVYILECQCQCASVPMYIPIGIWDGSANKKI